VIGFGDKAYSAPDLAQMLKAQETQLLTPHKKPKGGALSETQKSYNRMVNRLRQPIESFFKWLNENPQILNASNSFDRKFAGAMLGKLACAVFSLVFNY